MIAGIVLAAGRGERIGQPKAWLRTDREGQCFLGRACDLLAAAGASPIVCVIAHGGEDRVRQAAPEAVVVVNQNPEAGQLSSLQLGLRAAADFAPEAAVVLPVDVPLVTAATVRALLDRWRESRPPVVRPVSRDGRHGHPVVFSSVLFDQLSAADPSTGAKPIVRAYVTAAGDLLIEDEGAFFDVDTVDDYVRAFNRLPDRALR